MGNGHHHPTTNTRTDSTQRAELGGAQAGQRQRGAAGEPQDVALQALDAGARERAVREGRDGWREVRGWMGGWMEWMGGLMRPPLFSWLVHESVPDRLGGGRLLTIAHLPPFLPSCLPACLPCMDRPLDTPGEPRRAPPCTGAAPRAGAATLPTATRSCVGR